MKDKKERKKKKKKQIVNKLKTNYQRNKQKLLI
jgi:hypothetical protein